MATANTSNIKATGSGASSLNSKGTVSQVIGEVKVLTASGETRVLQVGDKVNPGDTIQTGADGAVSITFANGSQITLGHADSLSLTEQILAQLLQPADSANAANAADSAARIQELIAQGADPTQVAAASAAGAPGAGGAGGEDGGHSFVVLDSPQSRVEIPTGISTIGISVELTPTLAEPSQAQLNQPPDAIDDNSTNAENDALTTKEGQALNINPLSLLANDTDPDNDTLTIISVQDAVNGTVSLIDGKIVFTPNDKYNGPASFTYTISDGQGGTDTATVNITVTPVNEPPSITTDAGNPSGANDVLSEANIIANEQTGQHAGTAAGEENPTASGTITINDGDGLDDIQSISIAGQLFDRGNGSFADLINDILNAPPIGTPHGTLDLTSYSNGVFTYTFTLTTSVINDEGESSFDEVIPLAISDGEAPPASANIIITIIDDLPTINANDEFLSLVVDETTLGEAGADSTSFASLFTAGDFGADGEGDIAYALSLNLPEEEDSVDSGLVDTLSGDPVLLSVDTDGDDAGDIVGMADGEEVLRISVDAESGEVTLTQYRAVVHGDPSDPDESDTPATLDLGLVTLTATITDKDGDSDTAERDISGSFVFEDDGPSIDPTQTAVPSLIVDESDLDTEDGATTSAFFTSLFTAGDFGADGEGDIAYALSLNLPEEEDSVDSGLVDTLSGDPVLLSVDTDGDDAGDIVGMADGEEVLRISVDAESGEVTLTQYRAVVHGDPSDPDESDTPATLDLGLVTLTATITDKDGDSDTAERDISGSFVFEDDGPSIDPTQTAVPSLIVDESDLDTEDGATTSAFFTSLFTAGDFGADGEGDIAYALSLNLPEEEDSVDSGLVDTLSGDPVLLSVDTDGDDAGDIVGMADGEEVLRISVDAESGEVTLTQYRAVVHGDPSDPDESDTPATLDLGLVTLTATITDKDGDSDTAERDISGSFVFEDDGPSIDPTQTAVPSLIVDESDLDTEDGATTSAFFTSLFTAGDFGADGEGDIAYALSLNLPEEEDSVDSGLVDTLSGDPVLLSVDTDGDDAGDIVGMADGEEVLRISVDAESGEVTLTQYRAVVHGDPSDPDESDTPATLDLGLVTLTATITDKDGDSDTAERDISGSFVFEDDGPSIDPTQTAVPSLIVDESDLDTEDGATTSAFFTSLFTAGDFGADGEGDIAYALSLNLPEEEDSVDSGLVDTLSGDPVLLSVDTDGDDAGDIVGMADGEEVLRISVDAESGEVTLTQYRAVVHGDPSDPDESDTPATLDLGLVTLTATITDKDGDSDTAERDISGSFVFEDDGPSIDPTQTAVPSLIVDESDLDTEDGATTSAFFTSLFTAGDFGADGEGDIAYALSLNLPEEEDSVDSGLVDTLSGDPVLLSVDTDGDDAGDIVGMADGEEVLRISVDAESGEVTLTQYRAVVHGDPSDPDESDTPATLDLGLVTLTATITDKDGDSDTAERDISGSFVFEDDGPSIDPTQTAVPSLIVDESDLDTEDGATTSAFFTSLFTAGDFGADGEGDIAYALSLNLPEEEDSVDSGLVDTLSGDPVLLSVDTDGDDAGDIVGMADGEEVLRISVDAESGEVTLTQYRAVVHGDPSDPDESDTPATLDLGLVTLTATITDKDGDSDTAERDISGSFVFEDDGPSIDPTQTAVPSLIVDESDLDTEDGATTSAFFTSLFTAGDFGADGEGDIAYALSLNLPEEEDSVDSGLVDTLSGDPVLLSVDTDGDDAGDIVGMADGEEVLRISVDAESGEVTLTQYRAVVHGDPSDPDESDTPATLDLGLVTLTATITDKDGDSDTAERDISGSFAFEDDGPSIVAHSNLIFANEGSTPTGTGYFDYSIGADKRGSYSSVNSDFGQILLAGMVGNINISTTNVTWESEDDATANFTFSFKYDADPVNPDNALTNATGSLVFDKESGEYSVTLDQPLLGYTTLTTSNTIGTPDSYQLPANGGGQPEVVVSTLLEATQSDPGFYIQFTAPATQGGSGLKAGGDSAFSIGELFATAGEVGTLTISGTSNGVGSDTLQQGDVLDMDFFTYHPGSNIAASPDARVSGLFLKLNQLDNGDDLIVVLKLIDPDTNDITTRVLVVEYGDIALTGDKTGTVYIESNDYNALGENWQIYGAQLMTSTNGVSGTGINLNGGLGSSGSSLDENGDLITQAFTNNGATDDNDVVKVVDIGLITSTNNNLDAELQFSFDITDADGDSTAQQTLNVSIINGTTFTGSSSADAIQGSEGDDIITGGEGHDILNGGDGSDIFVLAVGADNADIIQDFNVDAKADGGDVLDISDLLEGAIGYDGSNLGAFLTFSAINPDNLSEGTIVKFDSDGIGNDGVQVATLQGVSPQNLLDTLISNGEIKTTD
ncbi:retention module-containing protein [Chitinibacter sp. S2-10]|uniref:retention module-containing protein n=1 Tax=Chitinibacter sp. S2-10 TaxID=3373597 RepID=UPI0039774116